MSRIHVHELLLMGILTALLFIGQVFLAFLPNIEIVSFLIILYTLVFGRKVFLMIYTFILLEGIRSLVVSVSLSLEHPCGNGTAAAPF